MAQFFDARFKDKIFSSPDIYRRKVTSCLEIEANGCAELQFGLEQTLVEILKPQPKRQKGLLDFFDEKMAENDQLESSSENGDLN